MNESNIFSDDNDISSQKSKELSPSPDFVFPNVNEEVEESLSGHEAPSPLSYSSTIDSSDSSYTPPTSPQRSGSPSDSRIQQYNNTSESHDCTFSSIISDYSEIFNKHIINQDLGYKTFSPSLMAHNITNLEKCKSAPSSITDVKINLASNVERRLNKDISRYTSKSSDNDQCISSSSLDYLEYNNSPINLSTSSYSKSNSPPSYQEALSHSKLGFASKNSLSYSLLSSHLSSVQPSSKYKDCNEQVSSSTQPSTSLSSSEGSFEYNTMSNKIKKYLTNKIVDDCPSKITNRDSANIIDYSKCKDDILQDSLNESTESNSRYHLPCSSSCKSTSITDANNISYNSSLNDDCPKNESTESNSKYHLPSSTTTSMTKAINYWYNSSLTDDCPNSDYLFSSLFPNTKETTTVVKNYDSGLSSHKIWKGNSLGRECAESEPTHSKSLSKEVVDVEMTDPCVVDLTSEDNDDDVEIISTDQPVVFVKSEGPKKKKAKRERTPGTSVQEPIERTLGSSAQEPIVISDTIVDGPTNIPNEFDSACHSSERQSPSLLFGDLLNQNLSIIDFTGESSSANRYNEHIYEKPSLNKHLKALFHGDTSIFSRASSGKIQPNLSDNGDDYIAPRHFTRKGSLENLGFEDVLDKNFGSEKPLSELYNNLLRSRASSSTMVVREKTPSPSRENSDSLSCPICFESYEDIKKLGRTLSSTVCGHIFCTSCLEATLKRAKFCPTCRKRLNKKQHHPLYI